MTNREFFILLLRHLPQLLFAPRSFDVAFGSIILRVHPRSSAFFIIWETYVWQVYTPSKPLVKVKTILDIGGYIGDFTVWAARQYPSAQIIALEPKKSLYDLLLHNITRNRVAERVIPLDKAIYSKEARLREDVNRLRDASSEFGTEDTSGSVAAVTLGNIMKRNKVKIIDYLKIDIEGGEKFVLTEENRKIFRDKVRFVSLETHDKWGFTKKDAIDYLESLGYEIVYRGVRGKYAQFEGYNTRFFPNNRA